MQITTTDRVTAIKVLARLAEAETASAMTMSERWTLLLLDINNDDGLFMSEIGNDVGLSRAAITALIDRLEAQGLVKRTPDATDRRRTTVTITTKGTRVINAMLAQLTS